MIVTRTPFRVSLFGGGTDYQTYYQEHGGDVLGFSINHYCQIQIRKLPPFFDYRHRICYSKIELVKRVDEIQHPVVRAVFDLLPPHTGIELHHSGGLPARSGLGSSSAFTVGLLNAMRALGGYQSSKKDLASLAIHIERDILKENVGSQDQVWASYGGFNRIMFARDGSFNVVNIICSAPRRAELNASLMLFFTGLQRYASDAAAAQIANVRSRQTQLHRMREMVPEALRLIGGRDSLDAVGRLLHDNWRLKRELADTVSSPEIDGIYAAGRAAGALGGKLLGAGSGGFMLFYVPPGTQGRVREALKHLVEVPFSIGSEGSKVVLFEPDGL